MRSYQVVSRGTPVQISSRLLNQDSPRLWQRLRFKQMQHPFEIHVSLNDWFGLRNSMDGLKLARVFFFYFLIFNLVAVVGDS